MESAKELNLSFHPSGTAITIEGPRFSTKPESKFYQSLDANVIGMTLCPEVFLAKEAAISYASIAMITDYDTWKEDAEVCANDAACTANLLCLLTSTDSYLFRDNLRMMSTAMIDWLFVRHRCNTALILYCTLPLF